MTDKKITIDLETVTAQLDSLKDEKARLQFELKQVNKNIEQLELQLTAVLSQLNVKSMDYGIYSFGWVEKSRRALDQRLLKEKYPQQFADCYVEKTSENFEFKINK